MTDIRYMMRQTQDTRAHPTGEFENNWQTEYILTRQIQEEAVIREWVGDIRKTRENV